LFSGTRQLLNNGAQGVQLFFMLSAFTLFNSSYRRFKSDSHPRCFFYLRRAFRILPLWWLVVLLNCFLSGKPFWIGGLSATFLFGFARFDEWLELVPGGWSLFVEETFYLLLPVVFGAIASLRSAIIATIGLLGVAVLWRALPACGLPIPKTNGFMFLFPLNHWYFFGIGITLYYVIRQHRYQDRISPSDLWKWDAGALAASLLLLGHQYTAIAAMLALWIYVSAREGTVLNRWMNNKLLMRLGVYCYSIYLLHFVILRWTAPTLQTWIAHLVGPGVAVEVRFGLTFPLMIALSLAVGHCCFHLIEKPCVHLGKFLIGKINGASLARVAGHAAIPYRDTQPRLAAATGSGQSPPVPRLPAA
jgi:peptidoglycan/LPS O-acetylase OafA/YrhL